ncbi:MAG TPA: hypothetical protein VML55_00080 [Planctomycetaceae bacterium]|nr:hypothetical protein [Planctomycetaceae bacterium]
MRSYRFTVVVSGVREIEPELADALYAATGGEIEFSVCNGTGFVEFDRTARDVETAIRTAVEQVQSVAGLRVVRIESDGPQVSDEELERRAAHARANPGSCLTTEQVLTHLRSL